MYAFPVQESSLQDTCVIIFTITQVCPCSTSTSESKRLFSSSLERKFLCKLWYFCGSLSVKLVATVHFALSARMHLGSVHQPFCPNQIRFKWFQS